MFVGKSECQCTAINKQQHCPPPPLLLLLHRSSLSLSLVVEQCSQREGSAGATMGTREGPEALDTVVALVQKEITKQTSSAGQFTGFVN